MIRVYRPGNTVEELLEGDVLKGKPVFPGFTVAVAELFPAKAVAAEAIIQAKRS